MTHIGIVFDGPPGQESGRFVEVENDQRESVSLGTWVQRDDGYWVLRIAPEDMTLAFKDNEMNMSPEIEVLRAEITRLHCENNHQRNEIAALTTLINTARQWAKLCPLPALPE